MHAHALTATTIAQRSSSDEKAWVSNQRQWIGCMRMSQNAPHIPWVMGGLPSTRGQCPPDFASMAHIRQAEPDNTCREISRKLWGHLTSLPNTLSLCPPRPQGTGIHTLSGPRISQGFPLLNHRTSRHRVQVVRTPRDRYDQATRRAKTIKSRREIQGEP